MVFGKYVNKFYKKYFWHFFFGILTVIFVDYIQLFIPAITGRIIDSITNGGISEGNWQFLIEQIIYIALVGLGMFVGRFLWRICIFGEAVLVQSDLRFDMFEKTEKLSQRYYKVNKTGAILSYFSNDLETIEESFGFGIVQMIDGVFLLVMSLIKMFKLQGVLTLLLLIPVVLLGLCAFFVDKLMEKKYEKRQKAFEDMSDYAQENFTGIRVIKAFVKERKELKQFAKEAKKNKDTNIEYVKVSSLLEVLFDALIYVIFGIILLGGSYLVYLNIKSSGVEGITIGSLIEGEIEFKNFNFAYPDDENTLILKDVNIKIKAGETIGIVGKIGSGKSTLVNMLFRLYNVEDNTLFIDGYDIMHLPIRMVRDTIGYCPQDNFLFSDSIRNNIAFSNPDMSLEEVEKAAEFADVRSNIEEFKDKYETLIGEKGVSLSGGQKQRISIARAIVKDPKILVLDDSVSAVDVKTEETILHNIQKDRKGKTTILIASRVSTVKALDKIIVMNDGKVEAFGTHEECLKNSKTYTRMVELQSLEKEMEGE